MSSKPPRFGALLDASRARVSKPATGATLTVLITTDEGPLRWWFQGDGRRLEGESADLRDLPAEARAATLHVWTPARATRISFVTSPSRDAKKIKKSLPFLLEETTLDEPEHLHFASALRPDGRLAVAITARGSLKRWLGRLSAAGLSPASVSPVSLGLVWDGPATAAMAFFGERACARLGEFNAFGCSAASDMPPPEMVLAVAEAREAGDAIEQLSVYAPPSGLNVAAWERALDVKIDLRSALALRPTSPLNLLQGDLAPSAAWSKAFQAWRFPLLLLGAWLAATLLVNAWDVARLSSAQKRMQKESVQLFRSVFPAATVIIDPSLQMERNLEALRAQAGSLRSNDFLLLLSAVAPAAGTVPGSTVKKLDYQDGALTATVALPDFQALETFKTAVDKVAAVEWLGAEGRAGTVETRFRIREAGR